MRYIIYTDRHGFRRRSLIRDNDPDTAAPGGIPAGPPDIRQLDWDLIQREINNSLVDRRLFTWDDVQLAQNALGGVILSAIRRRLISQYRTQHMGEEVDE